MKKPYIASKREKFKYKLLFRNDKNNQQSWGGLILMAYKKTTGAARKQAIGTARKALDEGKGIVRLAPNLVPRVFCVPGRRIKQHPLHYYDLGPDRGGWDERWFGSTTPAENGPLTDDNEGLSFLVYAKEIGMGKVEKVLLKEVFEDKDLKKEFLDEDGKWDVYSKFFDNKGALPFHIHHRDEHAAKTNQQGKPEAYYFIPQQNAHGGLSDYTYMGLRPGTTRDDVRPCLQNFTKADNRITDLSVAYRLGVESGWDIPAGVLHAPGSLCTFEPQKASDVFAMFENVTDDVAFPSDLLKKDVPQEILDRGMDAVVEWSLDLIDFEKNCDPDFAKNRYMAPKRAQGSVGEGYLENWICYKSDDFSAKELTILPGKTAVVRDSVAYSAYVSQGRGKMGVWDIAAHVMMWPGQETEDEYFVSAKAAKKGVRITNNSKTEPLVMLKTFASGNPDLKMDKVITQHNAVIYEPPRPLLTKR